MRSAQARMLAAITVAGAVLRFATLGVQSYWLDEAATVQLVRKGFGAMLSGVARGESTPPFYYVLAWVWARVFGTGEVGLRSLSALIGTATIPVAYALGRRVATPRAGLVAAALAAFNPLLVWYSQEARAYALLVLLTGLGLLALLEAAERPRARPLAAWAALSTAAMATHYYAAFLVAAEAGWLLLRARRRPVLLAVAAAGAAGAALLPLAIHQRSNGGAAFIGQTSLAKRIAQVPKQFLLGYHGPLEVPLTIVALAVVLFAWWRLVHERPSVPRGIWAIAAVAVAAILVTVVAALAGADYLIARNELATWLPLAAVTAAGLAGLGRVSRAGLAGAAVLCAVGLVSVIAVDADTRYQRDDWHGAADAIGSAAAPRVIVVSPDSGRLPFSVYVPGTHLIPPQGLDVGEVDLISIAPRLPGAAPKPVRPGTVAIPGFTEFARTEAPTYTVVRERAAQPTHVTPGLSTSPLDGRQAAVLYQR